MSRRRSRRSHRRYGGVVKIPGLGAFPSSVGTKDVLIGAAIGFAGTLGIKYLAGTPMLAGKIPDAVGKAGPLIGGLITGGVLYAMEQKKNKSKANGHLFGAVMAGAAVQGWDVLKTQFPAAFADVVSLKFNGARPYGVFVDERTPRIGPGGRSAYNGLIVDESASASNQNLAQLAAYSMDGFGDSDEDVMQSLMDVD